jgi:large conductance mechanosensitive channel
VLSLAQEFREFALKGNVVNLAVGLVIGAAFTQIVKSVVDNLLMPVINIFVPNNDESYTKLSWAIGGSEITYGKFLGDLVNFLIVALALFLFVRKFLGWVLTLRHREADKEETPPLSRDQELLTEIRDLLKHAPPAQP